jgi:glycosyltransferase involved in cell wall biosynthesis
LRVNDYAPLKLKSRTMRVVFAHDHRFHRAGNGGVYTATSFAATAWDRYLEHFDELRVIGRAGHPVETGAGLARSDREGVTFQFVPTLSSLRQLAIPSSQAMAAISDAVSWGDAVVARLPSEIGMMAIRQARRLGKPYAVEVVGCAWDGLFNHGSLQGRLYAPLGYIRARRAIAEAPLSLYVTSSWLQRRYPTKGECHIASNVYLVPMTAAEEERRDARVAELAQGRRPLIGTVASLRIKSKGVQTAIEALARLRASGLDLTYRVLGPGPAEPWQALAESHGVGDLVHFDGTRSAGEGVCSWLDDIDIHLQPSFQEGLPRATIEAMSRGAACIGSTCGGIPELLPAERLHRPGDVTQLASAIRSLATNPAAIAEASRADRTTAKQYHPDDLQARRSEFYARLRRRAEARVKS